MHRNLIVGIGFIFAVIAEASHAADLPHKAPPLTATETSQPWVVTLSEDFRYFSWKGTRGYPADLANLAGVVPPGPGSGSQVYVPVSLQAVGKPTTDTKLELLVRSGYVSSKQTTAGLSGSASTFTDTTVSGTGTYYGLGSIQPFGTLALNLPTGKSALYGNAAFARMDPDIVEIPTFGEGLNVSTSAGANYVIDPNTIFTLTVGYTVRGAFDREGVYALVPQPTTRVNPSNVFTVTPALGKQIGKLTLQTSFSYSTESLTRNNDIAVWKAGDRFVWFGWASYNYTNWITPSAAVSYTNTKRQEFPVALNVLVPEPFNSNSNVIQVTVDNTSTIDRFSFGPTVTYLHRDHNGYDSQDFVFVPAKTKWAAGAFAKYKVNDKVAINAKVQHIWIHEDLQPDKSSSGGLFLGGIFAGTGVPEIIDNAWVASIGGSVTF